MEKTNDQLTKEVRDLKAQIKMLKKRLHSYEDGATLILKASLTLNEDEIKQFWNR